MVVVLLVLWTAADSAMALPRYTARYGQDCRLCHVNPDRRRPAQRLHLAVPGPGRAGLCRWPPRADADERRCRRTGEGHAPGAAASTVTVGADLRTLAWMQEGGEGTVFSMQGDVYLALAAPGDVQLYAEQGQRGGGEVFGLVHGVIPHGYLKAGRFVPDYGWRFDDHRPFRATLPVRGRRRRRSRGTDGLGRRRPAWPRAACRPPCPCSTANRNWAATTRRARCCGRNWEPCAPAWAPRSGSAAAPAVAAARRAPSGTCPGGPVTWLGEIDETRGDDRLGRLVTNELTVEMRRGVEARMVYCFQDPDRDLPDGARHRLGAGVAWLARPSLGLQVMANRWRVDEGSAVDDIDRYDGELMVHFLY